MTNTHYSEQQAYNERMKIALGETISNRRLELRYEQRQFARIAGISNSHLRKIEGGETSPTLSTIAKIASALDTDAADLVSETCCRMRLR
ncbi:MAG: helix-turn-helix transcriptional regulator [Eggerthellaceae bacterium]|nr:helix-turn-helix transcriptional regulator [Eggerthellaceae bacterium]